MSQGRTKNPDDAVFRALMQAAQDGDKHAYESLLLLLAPIIKRVVYRQSQDLVASDVDDIVQDVLISLHTSRHTYDPTKAFLPWLLALCSRRLADGWRKSVRISSQEFMVESLEETFPDLAANSSDENEDDRADLHQAISALPRAQRDAIRMLKLQEMSLKEASAASGMSVTALKVATHRGIKALKASMKRGPK
jgi:RNA polymerase sigma-70 factor (ECF subfamily)